MSTFFNRLDDIREAPEAPMELGAGKVVEPALNRGWVIVAAVLFVVGYFLDYPIMMFLAAFFVVLRLGAYEYARRALRQVAYRRRFSQPRTFPGEPVTMTVEVSNRKWLPLSWLVAVDHWAEELKLFAPDGQPLPRRPSSLATLLFSLRGREQVARSYEIRPEQRGIYAFGPLKLGAGDPFGLFSLEERDPRREWLVVYPRVMALQDFALPYQSPFGDASAPRSLLTDPLRTVGVRDYRPEDSLRHVHWKASARHQGLQVRVFEPTTTYSLILVLNVATFERYWEGTRPEILERLVCAAASVASHFAERRWLVGLAANGAMPNADQPIRVPPGRGPDQLAHLLEALAGVTSFTTAPFERFLLAESSRLSWGATLVVVSAVVNEAVVASLKRLQAAGRRLVLVALTPEPPEAVPGILTYYAPNEGLAFDPVQAGGKAHLVPVSARLDDPRQARRRHKPPAPVPVADTAAWARPAAAGTGWADRSGRGHL